MKRNFTKFFLVAAMSGLSTLGFAQNLTITYNASLSGADCQPLGAPSMYIHSGAGTSSPTAAWEYVVGNWGQDDGIGQMTSSGTDTWEITIDVMNYYAQSTPPLPATETVYGIGCVFRSGDGSQEGKDVACSDIYIRGLDGTTPSVENADGTPFAGVTASWQVGLTEATATEVVVYPNPATDYINVRSAVRGDITVDVYNVAGQRVASETAFGMGAVVDVQHLHNGVYFYEVTVNNNAVKTGKVIVK